MTKKLKHINKTICPYCNDLNIVKNGIQNRKQRFLCKNCKKSFILSKDNRLKYDNNTKFEVIKNYLHYKNISKIERETKVPDTTILRWLKRFYNITKQKLQEEIENIDKTKRQIELIEGKEFYKYINKRLKTEQEFYGCLFTEDGFKFVVFNKK